jgi:hypothetical protein
VNGLCDINTITNHLDGLVHGGILRLSNASCLFFQQLEQLKSHQDHRSLCYYLANFLPAAKLASVLSSLALRKADHSMTHVIQMFR